MKFLSTMTLVPKFHLGTPPVPRETLFRAHFCLPLLLAAALTLISCSRLNEANFQKVHNGMTTAEVRDILGEPTSSNTSSALGILSDTTYIYQNDSSDVKITFLNDKVIATEGEFK